MKKHICLYCCLLVLLVPINAAALSLVATDWVAGLEQPWSLAFLPDGSALITELPGRLRFADPQGQLSEPLQGVPEVYFAGQGGLFDVVLHPDFSRNRIVYLAYAEGTPASNGTAVLRAHFDGGKLLDPRVIFRNFTRKDTPVHYGGRLAFLPDGTLLLTTGDGFDYREAAQDLSSGLGKVLRMNDDGSPAPGNPFPESPYVYSFGHRNPQGLAVTEDGVVWLHEHGPRGGDEVNRIEPGANYGWPAVTHGKDYSGAVISPYTEWEGMTSPVHHWTPSIAPSGLAVYNGAMFPEWSGDLLVGALVNREVRKLDIRDGQRMGESTLGLNLQARIRDVGIGPGGAIYILTPDRVVQVTRAVEHAQVAGQVYLLAGPAGNVAALVRDQGITLASGRQVAITPAIAEHAEQAWNAPVNQMIKLDCSDAQTMAGEPANTATPTSVQGDGGVRVMELPGAFSDCSRMVHFVDSDVIHMGDVYVNGMYPYIDFDAGGSVEGMVAAVQSALGLCTSHTRVIPARGPVGDCADLEDFGEVLYKSTDRVRRLVDEGSGLEDIIAARPTADFDEYWGGGPVSPGEFIGAIYRSLGDRY